MFVLDCRYNEVKDNTPVDQYGFVDLNESIANGVVPTDISNTEDDYNGIEDPEAILGKPHDVFEAFRMQDYIKNSGKKSDGDTASVEQK